MAGKITVITGPMSSSKTLEVIIIAKEAEQADKCVRAYHPAISSRWDKNAIVSRLTVGDELQTNFSFPSTPITDISTGFFSILPEDTDIVIFDDAQFFGSGIVEIAKSLRELGIDVYVCGLDMDCFQQPFGPMPYLMAVADEVIKKTTFCRECGEPASISYRLAGGCEQIVVGSEEYVTLCYNCWYDMKEEEMCLQDFFVVEEE